MPEAENPALEGRSEAPSELEGAKSEARTALLEGASVEQVITESGLSRPVVLGLLGAIRKKAKKISKSEGEPSENLGKANQEEETLVNDLRHEAKVDGAALIAARNRNRLKREGPEIYGQLHGGSEGSSSRVLVDLETAKLIRAMRLETEEQQHHRNDGDSNSQVLEIQREVNELKDKLAKKDIENLTKQTEDLRQDLKELRQELRSSPNSSSDLAALVKSTENIIIRAVESEGPIRRYLTPDGINIQKPSDAPALLRAQPAEASGLVDALRAHGLTTRVLERHAA